MSSCLASNSLVHPHSVSGRWLVHDTVGAFGAVNAVYLPTPAVRRGDAKCRRVICSFLAYVIFITKLVIVVTLFRNLGGSKM